MIGAERPAPIALFVYARPDHARRTIASLQRNGLARESDLVVYSDGARGESDAARVDMIRREARRIEGFKSLTLIERSENYGLARNITEGVTEIARAYGRVIVLEDDLETSPCFLSFMNEALNRYAGEHRIWHVSAWNYPIEPDGLEEVFFSRLMNCWGWATWSERWESYCKDPDRLVSKWSKADIFKFNLEGAEDFWTQVEDNWRGSLDTWAVFWYATIFESNGLCINPSRSFVRNIGLDGSGENTGTRDVYAAPLADRLPPTWPSEIVENPEAIDRIRKFLIESRPSSIRRLLVKIRRSALKLRHRPI